MTTDLPASTDVAVIGGGIMGTSLAWHLARRGAGRVTVFERATVAAGASGRTGALLRRHYTNRHEAMLAHASHEVFAHWPEIVGGAAVHTPAGLVVTVDTGAGCEANAERLRRNVAMQNGLGIPARVLSPAELRDLQPCARVDDVAAAAYEPDSGYVDAVAATRGMARAAIAAGVSVLERCPVLAVEAAGDRVRGVRTPFGTVRAGAVVCAAGPWSTGVRDARRCPATPPRSATWASQFASNNRRELRYRGLSPAASASPPRSASSGGAHRAAGCGRHATTRRLWRPQPSTGRTHGRTPGSAPSCPAMLIPGPVVDAVEEGEVTLRLDRDRRLTPAAGVGPSRAVNRAFAPAR